MKKLEAKIDKADRKTSLAAARKAGHLYYWKNGKKMAAVSAEDLSKTGLSLRDFMNKQLGLTRKGKAKVVAPVPRPKPTRNGKKDSMGGKTVEEVRALNNTEFMKWWNENRGETKSWAPARRHRK